MQNLKLKTVSNLYPNHIETNLMLWIGNHFLCKVTLHNNKVNSIYFPLILPKACGEDIMEHVLFTENLTLAGLSSFHIYQLYKECIDRYWKTSPYKTIMLNYHLTKAYKYQ
jgi:hypothetical protein